MRPGRPTATVGSRLFRAVPGEVFRRRSPGWLRTCYWSSASTRNVERCGWQGGAALPLDPRAHCPSLSCGHAQTRHLPNGIVVAFMADSPYHHPLVVGQVPASRTASQKGGPC